MSMSVVLSLLLICQPVTDRGVEPVAVETPAEPAEPLAAPAVPEPSPTPTANPPVQPQPTTPPAPAKPAPTTEKKIVVERPIEWRVDLVAHIGAGVHRDPAWRALSDGEVAFQPDFGARFDARLGRGRVF